MADLLSIGSSGLRAYSRALASVSDNIANSQTPGYARRTAQLDEARPTGDSVYYRNQVNPGGVLVGGVRRNTDEWLVADARVSSSEANQAAARVTWLEAAERSLDDGPGGVGESLTRIFNSADQLAGDPSNKTLRATFLKAVDDTASAFRRSAISLENDAGGLAGEAQLSVDQLNTDLGALERVNDGLRRARAGSSNQAGLLDERDRLVDQISGRLAVTTQVEVGGAVSVRAVGPGGAELVGNGTVTPVTLSVASDGQISFGLATGGALVTQSGSLAGLSQAATQISGQRSRLDGLASDFATSINAAQQAGFDANGNPGVALVSIGTGAATLTANALAPADVAAADAGSPNGNLLALANLRGAGGSEAGWANLVAAQSQSVASARAQDAAASARRDGAFEARDAVSAVDLDQEAADLLRFQQAYEGSARVIQVARDTLQSILNIF